MEKLAKARWTRPQLIILGKRKPEENVLAACKTSLVAGPGRPAAQGCSKKHGIEPCLSLYGS